MKSTDEPNNAQKKQEYNDHYRTVQRSAMNNNTNNMMNNQGYNNV